MLRKPIRTERGCVGHMSRNMLTEIKAPIELFLHSILSCSLVFLLLLSVILSILLFLQSSPPLLVNSNSILEDLILHTLLTGQKVDLNF